jgi:hypothetical protein
MKIGMVAVWSRVNNFSSTMLGFVNAYTNPPYPIVEIINKRFTFF